MKLNSNQRLLSTSRPVLVARVCLLLWPCLAALALITDWIIIPVLACLRVCCFLTLFRGSKSLGGSSFRCLMSLPFSPGLGFYVGDVPLSNSWGDACEEKYASPLQSPDLVHEPIGVRLSSLLHQPFRGISRVWYLFPSIVVFGLTVCTSSYDWVAAVIISKRHQVLKVSAHGNPGMLSKGIE